MGVNDREWMRQPRERRLPEQPQVVKALVMVNVIVFLLGMVAREKWGMDFVDDWINEYLAFSFYGAFEDGYIWQLITYQFMHANVGHILFNMICLWFFGSAVERYFGHVRFLLFYLVCGVAAALFSSFLGALGWVEPARFWDLIPMVGASGSIYGIVAASAILFPHARVALLFPPIEMSVRNFALVVLGIALVVIVMGWNNAGGEAGHLGGMIMGFLLMWIRSLMLKVKRG